jgi:excisionase family DNA binding protein
MSYSIGEAAKAVGVSKSTLSRAIKNGRISANRLDDGSYSIEPVELHRIYSPQSNASSSATVADAQNDAQRNALEKTSATGVLEVQLEAAREQLRDREDTIVDLRRRLDQSETERREAQARVVGLLSDQRPERTKGFWSRVFGV